MNFDKPLAYRMRPRTLEEYVGQKHILGKDKILYRTIKADRLSSIILFGPPGCGKTSLAKVISETTKYKFEKSLKAMYSTFMHCPPKENTFLKNLFGSKFRRYISLLIGNNFSIVMVHQIKFLHIFCYLFNIVSGVYNFLLRSRSIAFVILFK